MITLAEILTKLGIKWEDLNADEKATYQKWSELLKGEMTLDKIKEFLKTEIGRIEMEWAVPDNSKEKDNFLKAQMRILKTLSAFISSPERSREFLEQHLSNLFQNIK